METPLLFLTLEISVPGVCGIVPCDDTPSGWRVLVGSEALYWVPWMPFRALKPLHGFQDSSHYIAQYLMTASKTSKILSTNVRDSVGDWRRADDCDAFSEGCVDIARAQAVARKPHTFHAPLGPLYFETQRVQMDLVSVFDVIKCPAPLPASSSAHMRICALEKSAELNEQFADNIASGTIALPRCLTADELSKFVYLIV